MNTVRHWSILFAFPCVFALLAGIPATAHGAYRCRSPFTEADIQCLCRNLVRDAHSGQGAPVAVQNAIIMISDRVNVGDAGTFNQEHGCFEVSRMQISLFYETEERVIIDEFIDLGDGIDRDVILVKACQQGEKENIKDFYADASVQIFLKDSADKHIDISAGKQALASGESTTITSSLLCGLCPMTGESVTYRRDGPGTLAKTMVVTGEDGAARTGFTAGRPGATVVTASHETVTSEVTITTAPMWDIHCTFHYREEHPKYDPVTGNYNNKWRSVATFENIPLFTFVGVPVNPGDGPPPQRFMDYLKARKRYEAPGTFTDCRFTYYDGMDLFRGMPAGQPTWILEIGFTSDDKDLVDKHLIDDEIIMALHFKMRRGDVLVHYPSNTDINTPMEIRYRKILRLPSEKLLAGEPFSVSFEDEGYTINGATIDFTPRPVP